jgi:NAD(P)-dependent dehydrogenase (short-subunit alcohol dehydrogenase family)
MGTGMGWGADVSLSAKAALAPTIRPAKRDNTEIPTLKRMLAPQKTTKHQIGFCTGIHGRSMPYPPGADPPLERSSAMPPALSGSPDKSLLIVGASRGLGLAMAAEFLERGWSVIGTVRGDARTGLHDLADRFKGRVGIETLDICEPEQTTALCKRLAGRRFDILFVNAGVTNNPTETIADVTTEEFVRVMVTNALSPLRVIEALQGLVTADGMIGVMSSGQGSISTNETGLREVYRGSKAALNMFMRSYAARHAGEPRALVLMAPGWVRTDMGGPHGRLSIEESVPRLVNTLLSNLGRPGLQYLDYKGDTVPW